MMVCLALLSVSISANAHAEEHVFSGLTEPFDPIRNVFGVLHLSEQSSTSIVGALRLPDASLRASTRYFLSTMSLVAGGCIVLGLDIEPDLALAPIVRDDIHTGLEVGVALRLVGL